MITVRRLWYFIAQHGRCYLHGCQMVLEGPNSHDHRASWDHLVPRSMGKATRRGPSNMLLACRKCNSDKGSRLVCNQADFERAVTLWPRFDEEMRAIHKQGGGSREELIARLLADPRALRLVAAAALPSEPASARKIAS